ncbi:MAG: hypothetical protein QXO32_03950 [Candidatus Bathyarchaeia archaeon]
MTSKKVVREEKTLLAEQQYRGATQKRHATVRIPRGMVEAVEGFLKTEQAAKMGFDSKADVVTAAIRNLLIEYGFYKIYRKKEGGPVDYKP